MKLSILADDLTIVRLRPADPIPSWALVGEFINVVRTTDELSLVCSTEQVPPGLKTQVGWRALKVEGPLDFALTGIIASLATVLAHTGVSLFAVSTFDTDYILVKAESLDRTVRALRAAGHQI